MRFDVGAEDVASAGARSLIAAAQDELNRRYGPGADAEHLEMDELTPPRGAFVVAREDRHLAGGVGVRPIGATELHLGEVKRLWVRPDLRGSGVAALLMDEVAKVAAGLGMVRLYLETGPAQPEAERFYRKIGWDEVERFPDGVFSYPLGIKFTCAL
jgi:GNAT superfamily N-acetyltransferase